MRYLICLLLLSVCIIILVSAAPRTASLSLARRRMAGASVGQYALFGGGYDLNDIDSAVVDIYDSLADTWTTSSLSQPRGNLAATSVANRYVLFAGGLSNNGSSSRVDIFDSITFNWTTAELSVARCCLTATTVGTVSIFAGGHNESILLNTVDIFHADNFTWTTAQLSSARSYIASASNGETALFGGGVLTDKIFDDTVDAFTPPNNWMTLPRLQVTRAYMGAIAFGSTFWFAGGLLGRYLDPTDALDIYDAETFALESVDLPRALSYVASGTNQQYSMFAGDQEYYSESNMTLVYDHNQQKWYIERLSVPRYRMVCVSVGNFIIFAGGYDYSVTRDVVDIFDVTQLDLQEIPTRPVSVPWFVEGLLVPMLCGAAGGVLLVIFVRYISIYHCRKNWKENEFLSAKHCKARDPDFLTFKAMEKIVILNNSCPDLWIGERKDRTMIGGVGFVLPSTLYTKINKK